MTTSYVIIKLFFGSKLRVAVWRHPYPYPPTGPHFASIGKYPDDVCGHEHFDFGKGRSHFLPVIRIAHIYDKYTKKRFFVCSYEWRRNGVFSFFPVSCLTNDEIFSSLGNTPITSRLIGVPFMSLTITSLRVGSSTSSLAWASPGFPHQIFMVFPMGSRNIFILLPLAIIVFPFVLFCLFDMRLRQIRHR